jgi:hypothetical protein
MSERRHQTEKTKRLESARLGFVILSLIFVVILVKYMPINFTPNQIWTVMAIFGLHEFMHGFDRASRELEAQDDKDMEAIDGKGNKG